MPGTEIRIRAFLDGLAARWRRLAWLRYGARVGLILGAIWAVAICRLARWRAGVPGARGLACRRRCGAHRDCLRARVAAPAARPARRGAGATRGGADSCARRSSGHGRRNRRRPDGRQSRDSSGVARGHRGTTRSTAARRRHFRRTPAPQRLAGRGRRGDPAGHRHDADRSDAENGPGRVGVRVAERARVPRRSGQRANQAEHAADHSRAGVVRNRRSRAVAGREDWRRDARRAHDARGNEPVCGDLLDGARVLLVPHRARRPYVAGLPGHAAAAAASRPHRPVV